MVRTITPSPLPALDSPRIKNLRLDDGPYRRGYDMIPRAERHATERNAGEDIMSARVAGYLLLEFDTWPGLFGAACASIVKQVTSPPQGLKKNQHDVVFEVGKLYRDKLLRLCAFDWLP